MIKRMTKFYVIKRCPNCEAKTLHRKIDTLITHKNITIRTKAFKCLKCGNIAFNVDNFLTKYYAKKGGKHE
ncbi:hypothetical protein DESAMIL20_640 [Desulfurella amilsii]|uniref:Uncharacterized protein n=1 Tax=Desulfurella amilsii TaxID=1562698 RepID=A0A1X4XYC4_9BACT|nr:hypothetical protein [Desulfurella amilsii]OSS42525.1 hypothetical protein DESAMIL20_640 [Desulfurella amilsii]